MKINLLDEKIFQEDELVLEKHINFIYGKNGTGKSTLTRLIGEQNSGKDVRTFDGFEHILGDNKRLNAVVLGKENKEIDALIERIRKEIVTKESERAAITLKVSKPEDNSENLWTDWDAKLRKRKKLEKAIEDFYTSAAAEIRNRANPQIVIPSYDKRAYKADKDNALLLSDDMTIQLEDILRSNVKIAKKINFPIIPYETLLNEVNSVLSRKVDEKTKITRLNNQDKINFADTGRKIHAKGDVCAFCGSVIGDRVFEELESYFSADEVKVFQEEIRLIIAKLENIKGKISICEININDFYVAYENKLKIVEEKTKAVQRQQVDFLDVLIKAMNGKLANLFVESNSITIGIPETFKTVNIEYNNLVEENNANELSTQQDEARKKLKLHYIKKQLEEFNYDVKMQEIKDAKLAEEEAEKKKNIEQNKISGPNGLDEEIEALNSKIAILAKDTRDEKKLAENINAKLKYMVTFELVPQESVEGKGYYAVKSLIDNSIRDIQYLSTGEKNIIAFLYFVEKLNEIVPTEKSKTGRIIVFDDPMNSNDDNMQYLMMSELLKLINEVNGQDDQWFILLTHNKHFYINITYGKSDKYKKHAYYRLETSGMKTTIIKVTQNEDIKTSYESLWHELQFLYACDDAPADMLLNPIRRINETYYNFNSISANEFYKDNNEAQKLFNVNSHSIDDLEAELNGKTKDQILQIMKDCFENNNALPHFKRYWPQDIGV